MASRWNTSELFGKVVEMHPQVSPLTEAELLMVGREIWASTHPLGAMDRHESHFICCGYFVPHTPSPAWKKRLSRNSSCSVCSSYETERPMFLFCSLLFPGWRPHSSGASLRSYSPQEAEVSRPCALGISLLHLYRLQGSGLACPFLWPNCKTPWPGFILILSPRVRGNQ
jgi:hypothetical protein